MMDKSENSKLPRNRIQKKARPESRKPAVQETKWRSAKPDAQVSELIGFLCDYCTRMPDDGKPNTGELCSSNATSGEAVVCVRALYDAKRMEKAKTSFMYTDGVDVLRAALTTLAAIEREPQRYAYKPLQGESPVPEHRLSLGDTAQKLFELIERDFGPEIQELQQRLNARNGTARRS